MDIKKVYDCSAMRNNNIHVNYNLIRMSDGSKELKGNASLSIPFDDNLSVR